MDATLLRASRKSRGVRSWTVPGFSNGAKLIPASLSMFKLAGSFHWPARDDKGEMVRGVCLARHRGMAKRYARELLEACRNG